MLILFLAPLAAFAAVVLGTWLMGGVWLDDDEDQGI